MIEIAIADSDWSLNFESDRNQQSKLAGLESGLLTIQFVSPNRISLSYTRKFLSRILGIISLNLMLGFGSYIQQ